MMKILLAAEDGVLRKSIAERLAGEGLRVLETNDGPSTAEAVHRNGTALMILDAALMGEDARGALLALKKAEPTLPVIMLASPGSTPETHAEAHSLGANLYVPKPVKVDDLLQQVRRMLPIPESAVDQGKTRPRADVSRMQPAVWGPGMKEVYELIKRAASNNITVFLTGETGTGKWVAAQAIQALSRRARAPFLSVNCSSLSAGILESELFGHEKGAFTGAYQAHKGRFELANGGTLVLDDVTELDRHHQTKLLRVLQERIFERVGSSDSQRVDVRIIATTNRDPWVEVKEGRFREDLYYRLNVFPVELPPLRDRLEEVPLFVKHFLGASKSTVTARAMKALCEYPWPGNVREVENVMARLLVLVPRGEIELKHLPSEILESRMKGNGRAGREHLPLRRALREYEYQVIQNALSHVDGNKTKAAHKLGLSRSTLIKRLSKCSPKGK